MTTIRENVPLQGDSAGTVWQGACKLQKVHVRTKRPSVKQRCGALGPSPPQAVTDQVCPAPHPTVFARTLQDAANRTSQTDPAICALTRRSVQEKSRRVNFDEHIGVRIVGGEPSFLQVGRMDRTFEKRAEHWSFLNRPLDAAEEDPQRRSNNLRLLKPGKFGKAFQNLAVGLGQPDRGLFQIRGMRH